MRMSVSDGGGGGGDNHARTLVAVVCTKEEMLFKLSFADSICSFMAYALGD